MCSLPFSLLPTAPPSHPVPAVLVGQGHRAALKSGRPAGPTSYPCAVGLPANPWPLCVLSANQEPWCPGRGVHDRVSSPRPGGLQGYGKPSSSCPPTTDLSVPGPRGPLGSSREKSHGPPTACEGQGLWGPPWRPSSWQGWGWEPDRLQQGSARRQRCPQGTFSHVWGHFGCHSGGGRGAAQPSPVPGTAPPRGIVHPES